MDEISAAGNAFHRNNGKSHDSWDKCFLPQRPLGGLVLCCRLFPVLRTVGLPVLGVFALSWAECLPTTPSRLQLLFSLRFSVLSLLCAGVGLPIAQPLSGVSLQVLVVLGAGKVFATCLGRVLERTLSFLEAASLEPCS